MLAIGRAGDQPPAADPGRSDRGPAPLIREEIWRCLRELREAGQTILVIDKYVNRLIQLADRHVIVVLTSLGAAARIARAVIGGEHPVPAPVGAALRVFTGERVRHLHTRRPSLRSCSHQARARAICACRSVTSERGSMTTRSLPPLPLRTMSTWRSKSTSLTRSFRASVSRRPQP